MNIWVFIYVNYFSIYLILVKNSPSNFPPISGVFCTIVDGFIRNIDRYQNAAPHRRRAINDQRTSSPRNAMCRYLRARPAVFVSYRVTTTAVVAGEADVEGRDEDRLPTAADCCNSCLVNNIDNNIIYVKCTTISAVEPCQSGPNRVGFRSRRFAGDTCFIKYFVYVSRSRRTILSVGESSRLPVTSTTFREPLLFVEGNSLERRVLSRAGTVVFFLSFIFF